MSFLFSISTLNSTYEIHEQITIINDRAANDLKNNDITKVTTATIINTIIVHRYIFLGVITIFIVIEI